MAWAGRQAPWEVGGSFNGPGSGLYKSTDGGSTWKRLETGLPTVAEGLGRIGFDVAPSDSKRLYAQVEADAAHAGTYRSDDAGATWKRVNSETRVSGRGSDFAEVRADPRNADVVYSANTSTYRSSDGGKTFTAIKGAPGGDDYHTVWINPKHPEIILLAVDQGAQPFRLQPAIGRNARQPFARAQPRAGPGRLLLTHHAQHLQ